jgi:hypothetical protein
MTFLRADAGSDAAQGVIVSLLHGEALHFPPAFLTAFIFKASVWSKVQQVISRMIAENESYRRRLQCQRVSSEVSQHSLHFIKEYTLPGVGAHAFNPSTWEAEVGGFLSSRPAWSTE